MELRPVNKINVTWTILFSFCVLRSSFFVLRSSSLLFIFLVLGRIWIRISFSLSLNSLFILKNPNNSLCFFFHPFTAAVSELSLSPPSPPFSCFCKVCFTLPAFGSSCFSVSEKSYRFFLFVQSYVRVSMWLLASFFFPLFSTISVVFKKIK